MADASVIQIDAMLGRIGWSIFQTAPRSHVSRDRIMRWRRRGSEPPTAFMVWLTASIPALRLRSRATFPLRAIARPWMPTQSVARL